MSESKIFSSERPYAKIAAVVVVAAFLGLVVVYGIKTMGQTPLYEGDRRESLPCRDCQGTGQEGKTRCSYCLGAKNVKVIIPGPNHPLRLYGTIWNLSAFATPDKAQQQAGSEDYTKVLLKARPESVGMAAIAFKKDKEVIKFESKASGRYSGYLSPGRYQVSVEAPGFSTYSEELEIKVRTQPIWPEQNGKASEDTESVLKQIYLKKQ